MKPLRGRDVDCSRIREAWGASDAGGLLQIEAAIGRALPAESWKAILSPLAAESGPQPPERWAAAVVGEAMRYKAGSGAGLIYRLTRDHWITGAAVLSLRANGLVRILQPLRASGGNLLLADLRLPHGFLLRFPPGA